MSVGRVPPCLGLKGRHARPKRVSFVGVEAYEMKSPHAASSDQSIPMTSFFHMKRFYDDEADEVQQHRDFDIPPKTSILQEHDFLSPFAAGRQACNLRWNNIHDSIVERISDVIRLLPGTDVEMHDVGAMIDIPHHDQDADDLNDRAFFVFDDPMLLLDHLHEFSHQQQLEIVSFGLHGQHCGRRSTTADPNIEDIRRQLQVLWNDYTLIGTTYVYMIRPQIFAHANQLHLLIEFFDTAHRPEPGYLPVVRRIFRHDLDAENTDFESAYHQPDRPHALCFQAGLSDVCLHDDQRTCNVYVEMQRVLPLMYGPLYRGSILDIHIHMVEMPEVHDEGQPEPIHGIHLQQKFAAKIHKHVTKTDKPAADTEFCSWQCHSSYNFDDDCMESSSSHVLDLWCSLEWNMHFIYIPFRDEFEHGFVNWETSVQSDLMSLMQRVAPSQAPNIVSVRLVGLHSLSAAITVDSTLPFHEQMTANWPFAEQLIDQIADIHEVTHPPSYVTMPAEQLFIVEFQGDSHRRVHIDDVLTLITIKFHDTVNSRNSVQRARVVWTPRLVSRNSLMQFLHLEWHCRQSTMICFFFINNELIPELDRGTRTLSPGDHIRAELRSSRHGWCDIVATEINRRHQRILTTSSDEDHPPDNDNDDSLSAYTIRSRSRSRHRRYGDDSHSLLQIDSKIKRVHTATDPQRSDSQVLDRWCNMNVDPVSPSQTRNINLESCIAPPVWVKIPIADLQYLAAQLTGLQLGAIYDTSQVVKWHESTIACFNTLALWTDEIPIKYYFYTDGSSTKVDQQRNGASAIVLIVETQSGLRWGGSRAYRVNEHPTAPKTEVVALLLALLWGLQIGDHHPVHLTPLQIEFGYDCMMAGQVAAGQWQIHAHQTLQFHGRSLTIWLEQRFNIRIGWTHIASHQGHPWNEAADAISWAAVHNWIPTAGAEDIIQQLNVHGDELSSWLWMLEASRQCVPGMPLIQQQEFIMNIRHPHDSQTQPDLQPFMQRQKEESPDVARKQVEVMIRFATANVLTLFDGYKHGKGFISARQESIMRQMHENDLHFIGIQESRATSEGYMESEYFHILSAPATSRGCGGVQLWISKVFAFAHRQMHVQSHDLRILHSTSRRMIVKVETSWLRLVIAICHAPSSSTFEEATQFWNSTTSAIPKKYRQWPLITLCDANARVGSITSQSIGSHGEEEQNPPGEALHQWVLEQDMIIPQTFPEFHVGSHATWQHSKGAVARLDYVIVDKCLAQPGTQTWVSSTIDLTTKKDDHQCVCATCPWTIWDRCSRPQIKKDRAQDESKQSAPIIDWQCSVHDHAAQLQQWLRTQQPSSTKTTLRKSHLSESTWHRIQLKKYHWKRIRQIRSTLRQSWLRAIFDGWRAHQHATQPCVVNPVWAASCDKALALHMHCFRVLSNEVRDRVRKDDGAYYDSLASRTADVASDEGFPGLWKAIKGLLPKTKKKRQSSIKCCGPDPLEIRDHFNALEAGELVAYPELLHSCAAQQRELCDEAPLVVPLQHIPSRVTMEQLALRQKSNRAPGLDLVTSDTLKTATKFDSFPVYALMFKIWMLGSEPVQFKGGLVHCIAKKSASREASRMRGIMLLDSLGKLYHGLIRRALLQWVSPRRPPCQFGGFPSQQTLHATQMLRAVTRIYQRNGLSSGVLFVDVKAAFHCLLREMTFGNNFHFPFPLQQILEQEGFDVSNLEKRIQVESASFRSTAPPTLVRLACDAHSGTWFTLSRHDCSYRTHRGSRPGSPLADLAYNQMMQSVLQRLTDGLGQLWQHQQVCHQIGLDIPPLAWVDDVAIPFAADSPEKLDEMALATLRVVQTVFRDSGLRLNLEVGKTAAVLQYRGQGSAAKNATTFVEHLGRLQLPSDMVDAEHATLKVSLDYAYLGTIYSQTATLSQELKTRVGKAQLIFRQLQKQLFSNRRIPIKTRITLLNSLVVSIALHGAGNWPTLTHRQFTKLAHTIVTWHRTIAGCGFWSESNVSDTELLAQLQVPPLAIRLAKYRLLYAFQWASSAPQIAVECSTADDVDPSSWFQAVRKSIEWFRAVRGDDFTLPASTEETYTWLLQNMKDGPRKVRNAVARFTLQQKMIADVLAGHRQIFNRCIAAGAQFAARQATDEPAAEFACDLCSRSFANAQALQGHRWKWHGIISEERRYVFDAICRSCGQCWWTSQRLQQHLRYSRKYEDGCFARLQRFYEPLAAPVRVDVPQPLQRVHRLPKMMSMQPLSMPQIPVWKQRQQLRLQELQEIGVEQGYVMKVSPEDQAMVNQLLQDATLRWSAIEQNERTDLLEEWHNAMCWDRFETDQEGLAAILNWGKYAMYDFILDHFGDDPTVTEAVEHVFLHLATLLPIWTWMSQVEEVENWREPTHPVRSAPKPLPAAPKRSLEPIYDMVESQNALLAPFTTPMTHPPPSKELPVITDEKGEKYILVLHLFSGRRREGDCVTWVDEMSREMKSACGVGIRMVSVDTAIHAQHGDLDSGPNYGRLVRIANKGIFAANLSGPPCETWSAARHLKLDEDIPDRWCPRPLRTASMSWGIGCLSQRELRQATVGSRLMLNSLHLDVTVVTHGGFSLMEHPDFPSADEMASIWRTAIHRNLMMAFPGATEHHIRQWRYGAVSNKPTLLRALGMDRQTTQSALRTHEIDGIQYPRFQLGGVGLDGQFRTAQAKEYPPQLCKGLVAVVMANARRKIRAGQTRVVSLSSLSGDEMQWLNDITTAGHTIVQDRWLPDYQPVV